MDGGPPPNAPVSAAGLPAGFYVFQVTDPSGWVQLSEDPAMCRIVEVSEYGVIIRLVPPCELGNSCEYTVGKGSKATTYQCHIQDEPDGIAGPSGRHDTNNDTDHGDDFDAIVVQLMPFLDTPNPGGVYKAWMTPLERYEANGGDLEEIPQDRGWVKKKGEKLGFKPDPGFGPPRDQIKTDNFKVKEFIPPPELTVRKFHNLNANGVWDMGEPEIGVDEFIDDGGWPFSIMDPLGHTNYYGTPWTVIAEPPGDYIVEEEILDGWMQSAAFLDGTPLGIANPVTVTVVGMYNEKHEVIFGDFKPADICGEKFEDIDGDGVCDAGEPRVAGVTITLSGTDGMGNPVTQETTTNSNGEFCFSDLIPGTYTVTETIPIGWVNSTSTSIELITLISGEGAFVEFGNLRPAQINGYKFEDLDGDGEYDAGEPGVTGVTITLSGTDGMGNPVTRDTTTDATGYFYFMDVWPGVYTVTETVPDGYVASTPIESGPHTLVSDDVLVLGYVFGNFLPAELCGKKFHDLNGNGAWDDGEPGVFSIHITLSGSDGKGNSVSDETWTDESGAFCFMDLPPGVYTVTEDLLSTGWVNSTPISSGPHTLESGDKLQLEYIFGNFKPVDIYAHKFFDFDLSGDQGPFEQDLEGILIGLLDENHDPVTAEDFVGTPQDAWQYTDENCMVYWMDLKPGTYYVKEDLTGSLFIGLSNTTPTEVQVEVLSGDEPVTIEFGNVGPCNGLTPGYWKNWRNHYNDTQLGTLLEGTIADVGTNAEDIAAADAIFEHWDASDPSDLTILRAFVLANQLTINLTQHPGLPNPSDGSLWGVCLLLGREDEGTLGEALATALDYISRIEDDIPSNDPSDAEILYIKDILDAFANQQTCSLCTP
ncbi:MAG: collagen binding domain-containing protein [Candidatus Heimdallarchaeota archaeon]